LPCPIEKIMGMAAVTIWRRKEAEAPWCRVLMTVRNSLMKAVASRILSMKGKYTQSYT
jgi:hypothetical protein